MAFAIFRTHFLVKEDYASGTWPKDAKDNLKGDDKDKSIYSKIHMLSGKIAEAIRVGYTGGAVDMYIPKPVKGVKIFAYDVNSLFPFVMKNFMFPIRTPTYFEGNILKMVPNAFGFFFCKITAPKELIHPILQTHVKPKGGASLRTIAPLGTWEGMYFSEELINAIKYGYSFEVLWGYTFERGFIFKDYIDSLYNIRLQYPKSDPMNLVAKLLLNSLYGRFGMNDSFTYSEIYSKKD